MEQAGISDQDRRARSKGLLTMEMGTMSLDTSGFAMAMPPTALVTETAGVRTPSAMAREVPKRVQGRRNHLTGASFSADDLVDVARRAAESPVKARSSSSLDSSGGKRPWYKAKVPPSPSPVPYLKVMMTYREISRQFK